MIPAFKITKFLYKFLVKKTISFHELAQLSTFLIFLFIMNCASQEKAFEESRSESNVRGQVGGTEKSSLGARKEPQSRIITYRTEIYMDLEKDRVDEIKKKIIDFIKSKEGYIIEESNYRIQFKIPSPVFRESLEEIKKFATVTSTNIYTEDITDAYYDSKIRLENFTSMQTRLSELLKKARTVQEAIEVEKELNRVTNEIEVLKGKLNRYDNQINFSTFTVYLTERHKTRPGPLGWVVYGIYSAVKWLFIWE